MNTVFDCTFVTTVIIIVNDFVCSSESTSSKVQSYMLDSMVSVIQYGENIPVELLDVLLSNITPVQKVN